MQPKLPSSYASDFQVALSAGPPPKIYVGPKPRPSGPAVCWKTRGQELTRQGPSGKIRADFTGQFSQFLLQMEKNGVVSSFPIDQATLYVRNADGATYRIDIVRDAGGVLWRVDGCDLVPETSVAGHDGIPPEFFGDYLGISGWSGTNTFGPSIILG